MTAIGIRNGRDDAKARRAARPTLAVALIAFFALPGVGEGSRTNFCSQTARTLFAACKAGVVDDGLTKRAICINVSDPEKRRACLGEMKSERADGNELCRGQRQTRFDSCKLLGQNRYDPAFDPALFDDPRSPTHPNPYFPLAIGDRWVYLGGNERDTVEVVNETKLIAGVRCIVVRDLVERAGDLAEATDDWYAQAKSGDTWYFGEETKDYEGIDGDDPRRPELVGIEGSFKAGRNGDKPGIIFPASPAPGAVYFEEFSLANAEDATEILSTTYSFGSNPELDQLVPQQLATMLCSGDCVVTRNFSLLEPGIFARKYYAPGIGVFLEVELGEQPFVSQLVDCNFDPRCAALPP